MKLNRLHSITLTSLLALLLFTGCQDETDALPSEGRRTITLDLGIAMTRAAEDDQVVYGEANDLKIWLFDQKGDFLRYIKVDKPQFTGRDLQGNPVESVEEEFDITGVTQLQFRVLLNTDGLTLKDADGNALTLDGNTTMNEIDAATFQFGTTLPDADNKVPMYGAGGPIDITTSKDYHAEIPLTRAVGKLELFFTKESEASGLMINSVSITHDPDKGYLKDPGENNYALTYSEEERNLFTDGQEISAVLTQEEEATVGNFSEYEDISAKMQRLFSTYLLENPTGGTWTEVDGNKDYTYTDPYDPEKQTDNDYSDGETRYKMTVNYTLGSQTKEQIIYLPAIERNVWNKIFARVKDEEGTLEILYKVLPWNKVESAIGYAPEHIPTDHNPFDADEKWEDSDIANGNYYALFPIQSYSSSGDRHTTSGLLNYLYNTPEGGDNEARLCIITRPTYTDDDHDRLKIGSAGARYLFLLTGPAGATWEAHLTNGEAYNDFSFSTSEDEDFNNSAEYDNAEHDNGNVRKSIHGIARKKPYVIQIIANHLYTGYEEGMTGDVTEKMEEENAFADIKNNWDDYFKEDKYLTSWGEDKWKNETVVETEFYITVKLKDGTEYELTINPPYTDSGLDSSKFPFKDKHRYAGTDTRIWIRQIRAQYEWKNLEYLAQDRDPNENGKEEWEQYQWWMENEYWNKDHKWTK